MLGINNVSKVKGTVEWDFLGVLFIWIKFQQRWQPKVKIGKSLKIKCIGHGNYENFIISVAKSFAFKKNFQANFCLKNKS